MVFLAFFALERNGTGSLKQTPRIGCFLPNQGVSDVNSTETGGYPCDRAEAVTLVHTEGLGGTAAARKLGFSVKTYSKWIRDARARALSTIDDYRLRPVSDLQTKVSRLKRELAIACE